MEHQSISTQQELRKYCHQIANAPVICFDTEFVSENTYYPDLCLIQVAANGQLAVIDACEIGDTTPFWELIVQGQQETIVHAGREELRFCLRLVEQRPANLFDIQLAAGFIGLEYPAAYRTLVQRLLGESIPKGETRSHWQRRPLSDRQIDYALRDVVYLEPLRDILVEQLDKLDRRSWMAAEMTAWQNQIEQAHSEDQWWRVSGISGLSRRSLAIVRELWRWRDEQARERNRPARRVLRDDLIVELARRQTADPKRIRGVRGLERRDLKKHLDDITRCIERALALPDESTPHRRTRPPTPQSNLLSQFLTTALHSICHSAHIAHSLVGSNQDVRDLIAYHQSLPSAEATDPPLLARGWRAEVVGRQIEDLLEGRLAIRIHDADAEQPLTFEG